MPRFLTLIEHVGGLTTAAQWVRLKMALESLKQGQHVGASLAV